MNSTRTTVRMSTIVDLWKIILTICSLQNLIRGVIYNIENNNWYFKKKQNKE